MNANTKSTASTYLRIGMTDPAKSRSTHVFINHSDAQYEKGITCCGK